MRRRVAGILWSVVLGLCPATTGWAWTADRSAAEILKESTTPGCRSSTTPGPRTTRPIPVHSCPSVKRRWRSEPRSSLNSTSGARSWEEPHAHDRTLGYPRRNPGRFRTPGGDRWDPGGDGEPEAEGRGSIGRAGLEVADSLRQASSTSRSSTGPSRFRPAIGGAPTCCWARRGVPGTRRPRTACSIASSGSSRIPMRPRSSGGLTGERRASASRSTSTSTMPSRARASRSSSSGKGRRHRLLGVLGRRIDRRPAELEGGLREVP